MPKIPPSQWRFVLTSAPAMERIGRRLFPTFSGVLLIEAIKQIYGATPTANVARARRKLVVIPGNAVSARTPLNASGNKQPTPSA